MAPDKRRSAEKIDWMITLIMSIGLIVANSEDNDDEDIEAAFQDVLII